VFYRLFVAPSPLLAMIGSSGTAPLQMGLSLCLLQLTRAGPSALSNVAFVCFLKRFKQVIICLKKYVYEL
jgi:hypothetical protein